MSFLASLNTFLALQGLVIYGWIVVRRRRANAETIAQLTLSVQIISMARVITSAAVMLAGSNGGTFDFFAALVFMVFVIWGETIIAAVLAARAESPAAVPAADDNGGTMQNSAFMAMTVATERTFAEINGMLDQIRDMPTPGMSPLDAFLDVLCREPPPNRIELREAAAALPDEHTAAIECVTCFLHLDTFTSEEFYRSEAGILAKLVAFARAVRRGDRPVAASVAPATPSELADAILSLGIDPEALIGAASASSPPPDRITRAEFDEILLNPANSAAAVRAAFRAMSPPDRTTALRVFNGLDLGSREAAWSADQLFDLVDIRRNLRAVVARRPAARVLRDQAPPPAAQQAPPPAALPAPPRRINYMEPQRRRPR